MKFVICFFSEPTEAFQVLKNLTSRNYGAYEASFKDILKLMQKCDKLDDNKIILTDRNVGTPTNDNLAAGNLLMFGIVPGKNLNSKIYDNFLSEFFNESRVLVYNLLWFFFLRNKVVRDRRHSKKLSRPWYQK